MDLAIVERAADDNIIVVIEGLAALDGYAFDIVISMDVVVGVGPAEGKVPPCGPNFGGL